ncbi:TIGR03915 family putative DNA repair protein [Methylobacillus caricis]|uniref:TIGR03915 family putative DNA repair protein n=1 Tax=Methylobacillus caricis TaxID=1971611 RepID=UPI001CFF73C1|nr:TIGR03915 family putative DNA repair protein [Methylobacillus caricis]MCB5187148.1 TIGR03915 family putative DNA repair protein [Methylobacillus caricis]
MHNIYLKDETDIEGWRAAARRLIAHGITPQEVDWYVGPARDAAVQADFFAMADDATNLPAAPSSIVDQENNAGIAPPNIFAGQPGIPAEGRSLMVPRQFVELVRSVILHCAPERFGLLYRVLWRLQQERGLMRLAGDADVARLNAMTKAVRRDMHKMTAFVRFREAMVEGRPRYLAWFEPEHHIMAAIAPFFIGRFAAMDWTIMSPRMGMRWDGNMLHFLPGGKPGALPAEDAGEALWMSYYRHIFNPARLKLKAMQKEMPKKYWHNLPEAELITSLIAGAGMRTQAMLERAPEPPRRKVIGYQRKPRRPDIAGGNE